MKTEVRTGRVEVEVAGRILSIETGELARQASGAVWCGMETLSCL